LAGLLGLKSFIPRPVYSEQKRQQKYQKSMPQVGLKKISAMIEVSQIETKMCGHCKELYDRI
jgi:Icc-related predicted phosphoesterase